MSAPSSRVKVTAKPKPKPVEQPQRRVSTTIVKKAPKRRFNPIKKTLFYTERCDFCIELIRILSRVPKLGNCVDCISIDDYDVTGIGGVPAIDDNESPRPWELEEAFMWVIDQCNLIMTEDDEKVRRKQLKPEEAVTKSTVAKIEQDIHKIFQKVNGIKKKKALQPGAINRSNTSEENPLEKFRTLGFAGDASLAPATYNGVHSKELYEKYQKDYEKKKKAMGNIDSLMKRQQREREKMWEEAEKEWIEQGIIDPYTKNPLQPRITRKRTDLKDKSITDMDIRRLISEREQDVAMLRAKTGGNIPLQKPHERSSLKMGTAVTDRDIARYNQERTQHMENFQRTPARRF